MDRVFSDIEVDPDILPYLKKHLALCNRSLEKSGPDVDYNFLADEVEACLTRAIACLFMMHIKKQKTPPRSNIMILSGAVISASDLIFDPQVATMPNPNEIPSFQQPSRMVSAASTERFNQQMERTGSIDGAVSAIRQVPGITEAAPIPVVVPQKPVGVPRKGQRNKFK